MKYVIVTANWLIEKGFVIQPEWRKSLDGIKVILHYNKVEPVITEEDVIPTYESDSIELHNILNSPEWKEEDNTSNL